MKKLLVVDDDAQVAKALRRELKTAFEVTIAGSAEEALAVLEAVHPDLVLADFKMSGMNGACLLQEVKRRLPGAARALISGYADLETAQGAVPDCQSVPFLRKPWGEDLASTLERLLEPTHAH